MPQKVHFFKLRRQRNKTNEMSPAGMNKSSVETNAHISQLQNSLQNRSAIKEDVAFLGTNSNVDIAKLAIKPAQSIEQTAQLHCWRNDL